MKVLTVVLVLVVVGVLAGVLWSAGRDVLLLLLGMLFGALSGIPMALLMLAAQRRTGETRQPTPQPPMVYFMGSGEYPQAQQYAPPNGYSGQISPTSHQIVDNQVSYESWS
jgi:hypothetical protein